MMAVSPIVHVYEVIKYSPTIFDLAQFLHLISAGTSLRSEEFGISFLFQVEPIGTYSHFLFYIEICKLKKKKKKSYEVLL